MHSGTTYWFQAHLYDLQSRPPAGKGGLPLQPSVHQSNPLHGLMRLDTEYYTHPKRGATNWVMCLYLPVIRLISTMHVDLRGMGGRGNEITASRAGYSRVWERGCCSYGEGALPNKCALKKKNTEKRKRKGAAWLLNHVMALALLMVCMEKQVKGRWMSLVYWMRRKCVVEGLGGLCGDGGKCGEGILEWDIIHLHFRNTVFISFFFFLLPPSFNCFFCRMGMHSPVKSHQTVEWPDCRK